MSYELFCGDALALLPMLPADSVQTVVTSPPYYGLRDYGVDGQIGLEQTPDCYTEKLVQLFREVRRVLRADGTLWVNLGDSYASDTKWGGQTGGKHVRQLHGDTGIGRRRTHTGLKPKDLIGIPWRVAFALQADGWYLRQDIIWSKPNAMPESVTDRCTKAHEYVFLLSKSERYYYDAEAIKEPAQEWTGQAATLARTGPVSEHVIPGQSAAVHRPDRKGKQSGHGRRHAGFNERWDSTPQPATRNKRSVWTIATEPYPEAHFATYPTKLVEPCILAGSRVGDTVLDPFNGSGTTGYVAVTHGRNYIGIDLNPAYIDLAHTRIDKAGYQLPMFE